MPLKINSQPFYVSPNDAPAKQKILVTALHLFVRDGLCETSIRDIAKASGFTNPALFKHFATKDALADYLFERCYVELFEIVARASRQGRTFAERHRAVIDAYLHALDQDIDSVLYVQDGLRHFWPRMAPAVRKYSILGEVRRLLDDGRKEGAVTQTIDINLMTAAWVGTLQQFARARYFGDFRQSSNDIAEALEALLTRMIQK